MFSQPDGRSFKRFTLEHIQAPCSSGHLSRLRRSLFSAVHAMLRGDTAMRAGLRMTAPLDYCAWAGLADYLALPDSGSMFRTDVLYCFVFRAESSCPSVPLPSRARAKSCASKGRRSSIFSPSPTKVMGRPN